MASARYAARVALIACCSLLAGSAAVRPEIYVVCELASGDVVFAEQVD